MVPIPLLNANPIELFRTDARAEGEEVWVGGWAVSDNPNDKGACRWFAEQLTRQSAPWAFLAGESYRSIATLELMATLLAVEAFGLPQAGNSRITTSAGTDNLGNRFALSKMMTTKHPLVAALMELAWKLHAANVNLDLYWLPRLQNSDADALTNCQFNGFDPAKRCRIDIASYKGKIFHQMLVLGEGLCADILKGAIGG